MDKLCTDENIYVTSLEEIKLENMSTMQILCNVAATQNR